MEMELIFISEISQLAPELYAWLPVFRNAWASERFRNDVCNTAYKNVKIGAAFAGRTDPSCLSSFVCPGTQRHQSLEKRWHLQETDFSLKLEDPQYHLLSPPESSGRFIYRSLIQLAFPEHLPGAAWASLEWKEWHAPSEGYNLMGRENTNMPPAYLGGTSGCAPNQIHHSKQRMEKATRAHEEWRPNGGQMSGWSKGNVLFLLVSPAAYTAAAPSSLGNPFYLTAEATMTDGSTLFQRCEIMPLAFHGLGPIPHLFWSWSSVGPVIQKVCFPRDLLTFLEAFSSLRTLLKLEFWEHS